MATNPNIALSYRPNVALDRRDPLADAANIQSLQANQSKMDDLREFKEFTTRLAAAGKNPDPLVLVGEMRASGRPELVMKALELETNIKALGLEEQAYKALIKGSAPAGPSIPQAAPAAAPGSFAADVAARRGAGVNALAPTPAASTNALTPAPAMEPQAQEINRLMGIATQFPTTKAGAQAMKSAELLQRMQPTTPADVATMRALGYPMTTQGFQEYKNATKPSTLRSPEEEAQAIRIARESRPPRPEAAPRTQQVTMDDGAIGIMNMDTGAIIPATMAGAPVKGKSSKEIAVSEQQASYNLGRILDAAKEINAAIKKDPGALKPGVGEAAAASVGLSGTANVARNAQRQIVFGAQRDALDAMLYLATGAAYNKEQLEGQMAAYVPAFTDKPDAVEAKRTRMLGLIQNAKVRAGKAWTPEMDAASQVLFQPIVSGGKPAASGATGGWSVVK